MTEFALTPEYAAALVTVEARPGSTRSDGWRRNAARRLAKMHQRYGHGPEGQTCKGCIFLTRMRDRNPSKRWFKCRKQNPQLSGHVGTDWRAKWRACGAYEAEA